MDKPDRNYIEKSSALPRDAAWLAASTPTGGFTGQDLVIAHLEARELTGSSYPAPTLKSLQRGKQRAEIGLNPDKGAYADPQEFTQGRRIQMKLNSLARISLAAMLAVLPATLSAQGKVTVQQVALEKESFELIDQIEDVARSVQHNTDALRMHAGRNMSRWTNGHHLTEVKGLVNNGLNPALNRLTEIEPQLPAWQQHAIDRMLESARALAADTNSAILNLNENGSKPIVLNDEYRIFLDTMDEHAKNLASTADAAGGYADALSQALEAGLKVPSRS